MSTDKPEEADVNLELQQLLNDAGQLMLDATGLSSWGEDRREREVLCFTAWLAFSGTGPKRVVVEANRRAAAALTASYCGGTPAEHAGDDAILLDMLGEVANVVGGNLQPSLPGAEGIGLPNCVAPTDAEGPRVWVAFCGPAGERLRLRLDLREG